MSYHSSCGYFHRKGLPFSACLNILGLRSWAKGNICGKGQPVEEINLLSFPLWGSLHQLDWKKIMSIHGHRVFFGPQRDKVWLVESLRSQCRHRNQTQHIKDVATLLAATLLLQWKWAELLWQPGLWVNNGQRRWFTHSSRGERNKRYTETIGNRWRNGWVLSMAMLFINNCSETRWYILYYCWELELKDPR